MNETWENSKKANFGPDFGWFRQNVGFPDYYGEFYVY